MVPRCCVCECERDGVLDDVCDGAYDDVRDGVRDGVWDEVCVCESVGGDERVGWLEVSDGGELICVCVWLSKYRNILTGLDMGLDAGMEMGMECVWVLGMDWEMGWGRAVGRVWFMASKSIAALCDAD